MIHDYSPFRSKLRSWFLPSSCQPYPPGRTFLYLNQTTLKVNDAFQWFFMPRPLSIFLNPVLQNLECLYRNMDFPLFLDLHNQIITSIRFCQLMFGLSWNKSVILNLYPLTYLIPRFLMDKSSSSPSRGCLLCASFFSGHGICLPFPSDSTQNDNPASARFSWRFSSSGSVELFHLPVCSSCCVHQQKGQQKICWP